LFQIDIWEVSVWGFAFRRKKEGKKSKKGGAKKKLKHSGQKDLRSPKNQIVKGRGHRHTTGANGRKNRRRRGPKKGGKLS